LVQLLGAGQNVTVLIIEYQGRVGRGPAFFVADLKLKMVDILPNHALIAESRNIVDMISITKWPFLAGRISNAKGRRAKEWRGHYGGIF